MELSNRAKLIGRRVFWRNIIFLLCGLIFIGVSIWLYISMKAANNPENILVVMFYMCMTLAIIFLIICFLMFLRKKDAIYLDSNALVIKTYKTKMIYFDDIENIQMSNYRYATSGVIVITLKNNKKIFVNDIRNVQKVCFLLRKIILDK